MTVAAAVNVAELVIFLTTDCGADVSCLCELAALCNVLTVMFDSSHTVYNSISFTLVYSCMYIYIYTHIYI